jgi:subtilisin family serine protease
VKRLRRFFIVAAAAALCASAFAASDPTYTALRAARPDGRFIALNNFTFDRDIPRFTSKVDITDAGGGKYKLSGSVSQSEVSANFATVLPLYLVFDKGQTIKIGSVPLIGNTSKDINVELPLPQRPKSFAVNAMHDILAR